MAEVVGEDTVTGEGVEPIRYPIVPDMEQESQGSLRELSYALFYDPVPTAYPVYKPARVE